MAFRFIHHNDLASIPRTHQADPLAVILAGAYCVAISVADLTKDSFRASG